MCIPLLLTSGVHLIRDTTSTFEDQMKSKTDVQKSAKRKALQENLLKDNIESITYEEDQLARKVEIKHEFSLLATSMAFRQKVSEKAGENVFSLC